MLKAELEFIRYSECEKTPKIHRKPRVLLLHEATPNVLFSLDVMRRKIRNKQTDILVMIDQGDMLLGLKTLSNHTALTALNELYIQWISTFDSPMYVSVDHGSNLLLSS